MQQTVCCTLNLHFENVSVIDPLPNVLVAKTFPCFVQVNETDLPSVPPARGCIHSHAINYALATL
jgi:hypothetical protein